MYHGHISLRLGVFFLGFVGLMSAVLAPFLGCTTVWHWSASTSTFHIWYPLWVFADIVWCWQGCVSWWDDLVRAGHSKSSLMVHSFKTWIKLAKSLVRCAIFPSLQLQLVCTFHLLFTGTSPCVLVMWFLLNELNMWLIFESNAIVSTFEYWLLLLTFGLGFFLLAAFLWVTLWFVCASYWVHEVHKKCCLFGLVCQSLYPFLI